MEVLTLKVLKSNYKEEGWELLGVFRNIDNAVEAFKDVARDSREIRSKKALNTLAKSLKNNGVALTYNTAYIVEDVKVDELLVGLSGMHGKTEGLDGKA